MEIIKLHSKVYRLFFFWVGIIATFVYRAIIVVNNYSHFWAQVLWYVGTIGFMFYFAHRFQISQNRAKLIKGYGLSEKIKHMEGFDPEEKSAMQYIFNTLTSSKEKWNYIFIFTSSFLALILGLYLDFFRK